MRVNPRDMRGTEKAKTPMQVDCSQTDCLFHEGAAPAPHNRFSLCSHLHKRQHLLGKCPLYQLDWMKKLKR